MSANTTDHYWSLIEDRWGARVHLKWRANIYSGATPSRDKDEYWVGGTNPWIGSGEVNQGIVSEPTALISDLAVRETSTKPMRKGALIIALAGQGKTKGTVAQLGIDCFGNQSLSCIDARDDDDRFLFWWLTSLYRQIRGLASDDSRDGLNQEMVGSIPIPIVAVETQRKIANHLDGETARIDGLIAEKERMLALLEEKRAALICRVVTRGLDPNVPLKPSDQEWLGEIPAHWELWRLKHLGRVESGSGFPHEFQGNEDSELLFLKVSDMSLPGNEYRISASNHTVSREVARELSATVLPSGAVVYAKIGAALLLNKRRVLQREACIDNNMSAFVPSRVTSEWAHAWLSILDFGEFVNPGAIPSFTEGQQKDLPMAVPPVDEQKAITRSIEHANARTSALKAEIARSIDLLRERRAALITAAVTGQISLEEMTE